MKLLITLFISTVLLLQLNYFKTDNRCSKNLQLICDSIPQLNKDILAFVKTKIGKKVGTGECWDLAAEALNSNNATWNKKYIFGKEVDYKTECVFPGDIMQFEGIAMKYEQGNKKFTETLPHHTAIIYEVKGQGDYVIADQNTSRSGRKVGLGSLELNTITKGRFKIFRPTK